MSATLLTRDGAQRVRIRNLTALGAQLQLDSNVSPGSDAIFKRGSLFAAAHVAWTRELWAGIRFYRPLSQFEWAEADEGLAPAIGGADGSLVLSEIGAGNAA